MASKLTLKKERLAELTSDDLRHVVGAVHTERVCIAGTLLNCGPSWQACTTAETCGCQATWNCA